MTKAYTCWGGTHPFRDWLILHESGTTYQQWLLRVVGLARHPQTHWELRVEWLWQLPPCMPADLLPLTATSDWSPTNPTSSLPQHISCLHDQTIVSVPSWFLTSSLSQFGSLSEPPWWCLPLASFCMSSLQSACLCLVPCSVAPSKPPLFPFWPALWSHHLIDFPLGLFPWLLQLSKYCSTSVAQFWLSMTSPLSSLFHLCYCLA